MKKYKIDTILQCIARNNDTSVEQVIADIQEAIQAGCASADPAAQAFWASVPREQEIPTVQELLSHILHQQEQALSGNHTA